MAKFIINTTGTLDPVIFYDLGYRTFYTADTVNYDLTNEFTLDEIAKSLDVQNSINNGYITAKDEFGHVIYSSTTINITTLSDGSNTNLSGNSYNPIVNLNNNIYVNSINSSGSSVFSSFSAVAFSATTITIGGNTFAGTGSTFNSLSAGTISGDTLYSGSTNLYDIFLTSSDGNDITRLQNGLNTYTGGTANNPIINVSGLTINNINVSGNSVFNTLSALTLSASTIYSGTTNLDVIINSISSNSNSKFDKSGGTINGNLIVTGTTTVNQITGTIFSGGTFYGDGSNLSGISNTDYFVTGGTINNNILTLDRQNGSVIITGLTVYTTGATNVGTGFTLFNSVSNQNIDIKTLIAGPNISIISSDSGNSLTIGSDIELSGPLRDEGQIVTIGNVPQKINTITGFTNGSYIVESYITSYDSSSSGFWKRILGVFYTGGTPIIRYEKADLDKQNGGLKPVSVYYVPTTGGTIDIYVSGSTGNFNWTSYHEVIDDGNSSPFDVSHYSAFGITIDGSGVPITSGNKGYVTIPYPATIYGWDIIGNTTGNCYVELWKTNLSSFPPTSANTITGNQPPILTNQIINRNDSLTGWTTTSINNNDIIAFIVKSATTISRVTLTIKTIKN